MKNYSFSLMYHDVLDHKLQKSGFQNTEAYKYKIEKQKFEEQIDIVARNIEKRKLEKNNLFLTFDDGGISFIDIIAPVLEKYGLKGYFFITTSYINENGFISKDGIIELDRRGHFIGIHSHTHPPNISLLKKDQLRAEWEQSLEILKGILSKDILYASIPNGFFSDLSLSILSEKGIQFVFTSEPKNLITEENGVKIIGRYVITKNTKKDEVERLMQSFSIIKFKKIILWKVLGIIKRTMGKNYFRVRQLFNI